MEDRQLDNTNTTDTKKTTSDVKVTGDPDVWELVCKASSQSQGWMKSTKRMRIPDGWLYQVTTEHRSGDRARARHREEPQGDIARRRLTLTLRLPASFLR